MAAFGLDEAPAVTTAQIARFLGALSAGLGDSLVGVYLHGSLALGCFNPAQSDLDFLVVVDRPMTGEERRALAQALLTSSARPHPIEMSVMRRASLRAWRHPAPFEFHYGEDWRGPFEAALSEPVFALWSDPAQTDRDLAAHVTLTRRRGRRLAGPPITDIWPAIPAADYADAVLADLAWLRPRLAARPVYAVLNTCRALAWARDGLVLSKAEGGAWAQSALPDEFQALVEAARAAYAGERAAPALDLLAIDRFVRYGEAQCHRLIPNHHVPA